MAVTTNVDVIERDLGLENFLRAIAQFTDIDGVFVTVGIRGEDSTSAADDDLATIALVQEMGSRDGRIPARPFMSATLEENAQDYLDEIEAVTQHMIDTGDVETAIADMERLGLVVTADIQDYAVALKDPPNARATIEAKGSDNPLVDTTTMIKAISSAVTLDVNEGEG